MTDLRDSQLNTLWMSGKGYSREKAIDKHRHDFYQLQYLVSGSETLIIEGTTYQLKPNYLSILDSNVYHAYSFNKESKLIDIKFRMIKELRSLMDKLFTNPVFLVKDEMIRNKFSQLIDQGVYFQNYQTNNILINIDTQVKLLLLELTNPTVPEPIPLGNQVGSVFPVETDSDTVTTPMLNYLIENYDDKMTLDQMSTKFHYSKPQIIKLFSDEYNQTPIHVLQKIRLQHAKILLAETDKSIGQIANEVGFSNNYFTKVFLRYENQLPSDYRLGKRRKADEILLNTSFDITMEP